MMTNGKMLAFINALAAAPAPTEVVILPETELTPVNVEPGSYGNYFLAKPLDAVLTVGGMCEVTWAGTKYVSKVVDGSAIAVTPLYVLGNLMLLFGGEIPEGFPIENPDPSAPYVLQITPGGLEEDGIIAYALMQSQGITPDPPVLSIVQTEGGTDSGNTSTGGGVCVINVTCDGEKDSGTNTYPNATMDKPFNIIKAFYDAGGIVICRLTYTSGTNAIATCDLPLSQCVAGMMFIFNTPLTTGQLANYIAITPDNITVAFN